MKLKIILLLFNFVPLFSMQHDLHCNESLNLLPHSIMFAISDSSFFSTFDSNIIEDIKWNQWNKEELSLICSVLNLSQKNISPLLKFIYSLQQLFNSLENKLSPNVKYNILFLLLNSLTNHRP